MYILWTQVVKEQDSINYVLIMWSYNNHIWHWEQIQNEYSHAYYQSVNHLLTSGMVPWCQSEEPKLIRSSQFIIVALYFLPIFRLDAQSATMAELTYIQYIFRQGNLPKRDIYVGTQSDWFYSVDDPMGLIL